ncbi:MAG TPA: hydantoinase/oxoprolinase family protein, partial [Actinomycetota bacterium]|nr:hydantoinase/oxoprolinase family protein [Actinomycetota bacterium]
LDSRAVRHGLVVPSPAAAGRPAPRGGVGLEPGLFVGVDTGGTFTDAVIIDRQGRVYSDKAHSTPANPAIGAMQALRNVALAAGLDVEVVLDRCLRLSHGTTVGTNALIERRGARVGLITTRGFEDTVLIGRGPMGKNMGIPLSKAMDFVHNERPEPLVDPKAIIGVQERIDLDGDVIVALSESDVVAAVARLREAGCESVAVSLLWSFRNDAHERRIAEMLGTLAPEMHVSLSTEIAPVIGEFERSMTAIVNAFVSPALSGYVADLSGQLEEGGLRFPLQLMTSSGGAVFPRDVKRSGVRLINGGPAGGLVAAQRLGHALGFSDVITADMGGTSFDVGLIYRGAIESERSIYVSQGTPALVNAARLVTIGAGGGSIAWSDGKHLQVGPSSAGAIPGPACYGQGGEEPTVTDALVVLGLLSPERFFGGREQLDPGLAEKAISDRVAGPLGMTAQEAAAGIYEIVTARMRDLIRQMTVESGHDTRGFALFAYGGAAALHAAGFSARLGLREVVVPHTASVFSAYGCAMSDVLYTYARSLPVLLAPDGEEVPGGDAVLAALEEAALADMASLDYAPGSVTLRRGLDVRYAGQMNEIALELDRPLTAPNVRDLFESAYLQRYGEGTVRSQTPIEVITYRLEAIAHTDTVELSEVEVAPVSAEPFRGGTRGVFMRGLGQMDAAVYDGDAIQPGVELAGPALIERRDTTVWVPPDHRVRIDSLNNIRLSLPN